MKAKTLLALVSWGYLISLLHGCGKPETAPPSDVRPVRVEQVGARTTRAEIRYAGEVRPRYETTLAFRVGGRITARLVEAGSRVKAGQIIATLDGADYALAARAAGSQLAAARADALIAQQDLKRFGELRAQNFISQAELERRTATANSASARVRQLDADAARQGNQQNYTRLSAPYAGVITQVSAEPGEVVAAGQAVAQLARMGELEAVINVPENDMGALRVGSPMAIRLWSAPGRIYAGTLRELAPVAEPATRTYSARVAFRQPDAAVKLGMTATVSRSLDSNARLSVSQSALYRVNGQPQVWVVDSRSAKVVPRAVRLGELQGERAEILSGLIAGEWVVTAGVHKLAPGQQVKPIRTASGS